jgi:integrase
MREIQFSSCNTSLPYRRHGCAQILPPRWQNVSSGEAKQIEWSQGNLEARVIRLEDEQKKNEEARTVPLPSVLVLMLKKIEPKVGKVFAATIAKSVAERPARPAGWAHRPWSSSRTGTVTRGINMKDSSFTTFAGQPSESL